MEEAQEDPLHYVKVGVFPPGGQCTPQPAANIYIYSFNTCKGVYNNSEVSCSFLQKLNYEAAANTYSATTTCYSDAQCTIPSTSCCPEAHVQRGIGPSVPIQSCVYPNPAIPTPESIFVYGGFSEPPPLTQAGLYSIYYSSMQDCQGQSNIQEVHGLSENYCIRTGSRSTKLSCSFQKGASDPLSAEMIITSYTDTSCSQAGGTQISGTVRDGQCVGFGDTAVPPVFARQSAQTGDTTALQYLSYFCCENPPCALPRGNTAGTMTPTMIPIPIPSAVIFFLCIFVASVVFFACFKVRKYLLSLCDSIVSYSWRWQSSQSMQQPTPPRNLIPPPKPPELHNLYQPATSEADGFMHFDMNIDPEGASARRGCADHAHEAAPSAPSLAGLDTSICISADVDLDTDAHVSDTDRGARVGICKDGDGGDSGTHASNDVLELQAVPVQAQWLRAPPVQVVGRVLHDRPRVRTLFEIGQIPESRSRQHGERRVYSRPHPSAVEFSVVLDDSLTGENGQNRNGGGRRAWW